MGMPESIDNTANHGIAHRHAQNLARALNFVAFANLGIVAQHHGADLIFFEAQGQPGNPVREAEQFAGHDLVEPVQAGDAVAEGCDGTDFVDLDLRVVVRDLLAKKLRNLVCLDLSHFCSYSDQSSVVSSQCFAKSDATRTAEP